MSLEMIPGPIPDLLERYMKDSGSAERLVTVSELRPFFLLDKSAGPVL
jgi:hypothetical protein